MKAKHFDDRDRGQVGIGTLIVFIALVLVAAIAAGVLINTAGFLQSQSEQTGQESTSQVTDRLQSVAITGDNISDGQIYRVNVTVSKAPGAQDIDLRNVTVQWVGPEGTFNLLNADSTDTTSATLTAGNNPIDDSSIGLTEEPTFTSSAFKDASGSYPVLGDSDDRFILTFEPGIEFNNENIYSATGDGTPGPGLAEGDSVEVRITTEAGSTSVIRLSAPDSLAGQSATAL